MSDPVRQPLGDDRPTGEAPLEPAAGEPTGTRTIVAKGARVPWPRRFIALGLLAAVIALALHAMPRPYQPLPTSLVRGLADVYGTTRASYRGDVAALEPVAGEAADAERAAYGRELWRYRWLGSFREMLLRFCEWVAASCMFLALSLVVVERRRLRRALEARGTRLAPRVLREETLAGVPLREAAPVAAAPARDAAPIPGPDEATPPFPTAKPAPSDVVTVSSAMRQTGDEITPPTPTKVPPVPMPPAPPPPGDVRSAAVPSDPFDDDLARATERGVPNLAAFPVPPSAATPRVTGSLPLPVFFQKRNDPDPHPVVTPGAPPPPAEPAPTPAPIPTVPSRGEPARPAATAAAPAPRSLNEFLAATEGASPSTPIPAAGAAASDSPVTNDNPGWWPKPGEER